MRNHLYLLVAVLLGISVSSCSSTDAQTGHSATEAPRVVRFATFNIALNRRQAGDLIRDLEAGRDSRIRGVAEVIQRVRPDVILLNELDHDDQGKSLELFQKNFLMHSQNGQATIAYPHVFVGPVNTGLASPVDMNQDGKVALPDDGYGYGGFPGQYGMALLSKFPIDLEQVRTFQTFLWKDMPHAKVPRHEDGSAFYPSDVFEKIRLSSKSHWDIPVQVAGTTIHVLSCHPTPPVFDGPEDRNGCRNYDEIRLLADYISDQADYLYDDQGRRGGLAVGTPFVIVGDLNADPHDGDSLSRAARQLTESPHVNRAKTPGSRGAVTAATNSGKVNAQHTGDPKWDTGDFNDRQTGNLRIDYCLPAASLTILDCGVFWPDDSEEGSHLNQASDHHLVWVDIKLP